MRALTRLRSLGIRTCATACSLALLLIASQASAQLTAADWSGSPMADSNIAPAGFAVAPCGFCEDDGCCSECEDLSCSYGPCDCCPRMTLFQWSYGTSFEGGAPLDEPLVTDRPDFTEASTTVGRGVNQIEMGYTYVYDSEGGTSTRSQTYPEVLWRRGFLAEWLEFRMAWTYNEERVSTGAVNNTVSDSEDLYLGFKIALTPQECWLPEMALLPQMTVPLGGPFSAGEVLPGLNWLYSWELNDNWSLAGSTQANRAIDSVTANAYTELAQSIATGVSLTECVGAYAEWYAFFPTGADTETNEHYLNGGFTYLMNNDVQFDVRVGYGLNSAADDYFVGTGVSIRN